MWRYAHPCNFLLMKWICATQLMAPSRSSCRPQPSALSSAAAKLAGAALDAKAEAPRPTNTDPVGQDAKQASTAGQYWRSSGGVVCD